MKGGRFTRLAIPQRHRIGDKFWNDGIIYVLTKGEYNFHEGDTVIIKNIYGANITMSQDKKQFFTLYADIEQRTVFQQRAGDSLQTLEDDIPDELL